MVENLANYHFCKNCILGKATRLKFKKSVPSTTGVLNYIYSDLWGPSKHSTLAGGRYFLTLINGFQEKSGCIS